MGLTGVYNAPIAEEDGIAIIKYAFDQGITFFDTADVYGATTNEVLVGKVRIQHNVWLLVSLFKIHMSKDVSCPLIYCYCE